MRLIPNSYVCEEGYDLALVLHFTRNIKIGFSYRRSYSQECFYDTVRLYLGKKQMVWLGCEKWRTDFICKGDTIRQNYNNPGPSHLFRDTLISHSFLCWVKLASKGSRGTWHTKQRVARVIRKATPRVLVYIRGSLSVKRSES